MKGPLSHVRVRVTAAALLVAVVVGGVGSLLFIRSLRSTIEHDLVSSSLQQVQAVQAQLDHGETYEQAVVSGKNDVLVQVVDPQGTVVATDHPRVDTPLARAPGTTRGVRVKGLTDAYVVVARRQRGTSMLIAVGHSAEGVRAATDATGVLLATTLPVAIGLLAVTVWLAVGRALRPVEAMRVEASAITTAHAERRLAEPDGDDEIPRLARTLNDMLDRIDASHRSQRQFVSDASHELKSPLAALRQLAEVARDYPDRIDGPALASDVLAEEQRMEELVSALLLLARLDDADLGQAPTTDLDDVVLAEVRRARTARPQVQIDPSRVGAAQVEGDPVLLGQLVANLLSNAVRHAKDRVVVTLAESGDQAVLLVEDDGPGVPPAERERVFERFVRLDDARTRDAGGSGLGLAIVAKIVAELGGAVTVEGSEAGGAAFRVTLPVARSGPGRSR